MEPWGTPDEAYLDSSAPVTNEYGISRADAFTGQIDWVNFEAGDDIHDHLVDPEHIYQVAMIRQ